MRARKHLKPEDVTFLIDTREQTPLDFSLIINQPFRVESATLTTGDYSVKGLEESEICVERKSLDDLLGCVGRERERFERELRRMLGFQCRLVLVEASWGEIGLGQWRSRLTPSQVQGSVIRWMGWGIPFFFARGSEEGVRFVSNYMWLHAKTCFDRLRAFNENLRLIP
jgi:DNA excision repair protein ERCC-4